jgi:hypothetical protein
LTFRVGFFQEEMCLMNARSLTVTASTPPRVLRVLLGAVAALALVCATGLVGTAQAAESSCAVLKEPKLKEEEQVRAESRSTQLPQCRAYEMVSPVDTADTGVRLFLGAAPDGEAADFYSEGGFAGARSNYGFNEYIARRVKEVGWQTSSVTIPAALGAQTSGVVTSFDLTKQLVRTLYLTGEKADTCSLLESDDLLAAPALSFVELTEYPSRGEKLHPGSCIPPVDESSNFADVFFGSDGLFFTVPVSEISGAGGPTEVLRPVSVVAGETIVATLGNGEGFGGTLFHAISNDGSVIFFNGSGVLYARVNGKTTSPTTLKLGGGVFQGASEDGAKVFFNGAGGGLYMDVIDSKPGHEGVTKKVLLTPGAAGTYLRSGDDGSHVYFNSEGVLAKNENGNEPIKEKAEAGKENLYVYEPDPEHPGQYRTVFIAQALPGGNISEGSAEAQVNGCPSRELKEVVEPGCEGGRFFVFTSTAHITPGDTAGGAQVFEYDAAGSGHLTRVSLGEGGYDENGNGGAGGASIAAPEFGAPDGYTQTELFEDSRRAVSDDGSTVVFSTARALSPRAVNDQQAGQGPLDVYEYHDGQVGLISTGHSPTSDKQPTITPSGRDVFFTSTENILPQDSDGLSSLYDARIEGGFPAAAVEEGGCNGDACQGPPSVPNLLAANGSATFSGLGNPPPAAPTVKAKAKPKPVKCKKGYVKKKNKCVKKSKPKKKATKSSRDRRIK